MKLYQKIAGELSKTTPDLPSLEDLLPSGSGIDCGTKISPESKPDKIILVCEYHRMDKAGGYSGWTTYKIIITPDLRWGFNLKIVGKDHDGLKEYLYDIYFEYLNFDEVLVLTQQGINL